MPGRCLSRVRWQNGRGDGRRRREIPRETILDREIDNAKSQTPLRVAPEIRIVEGSPYFVVRDELKKNQPDLLAMGTRARGASAPLSSAAWHVTC